MPTHPVRPSNLVELLRREAEWQRSQGGVNDSAEIARLFEMAVDEIEALKRARDEHDRNCSGV